MAILSQDEISTIFVVGFPSDMKEREFQNLFTFAPGFEGAALKIPDTSSPLAESSLKAEEDYEHDHFMQLNNGGVRMNASQTFRQQIIGFARFHSRRDALAAREHLNGKCIDVDKAIVLKVEMAKKNLFIAPRKQSIVSFKDEIPLNEISEESGIFPIKTTRSLSLSIPGNAAPIDISLPTFTKSSNDSKTSEPYLKTCIIEGLTRSFSLTSNVPPTYVFGENPPCNTLYVGNLPLNVDEDELRLLFEPCPGYRRLSFKNKPNGPMCFVEFDDVTCARQAMDDLYGTLLSSSTKGGIRLSFSKNPLGVRSTNPSDPNGLVRCQEFLASAQIHRTL